MTTKLNWRPSTQKPETDELIKATIAVEGSWGWFLYSGYIWRPNIGWRHERTSTPPHDTNFMWIPENELTETIQPPERRNTMPEEQKLEWSHTLCNGERVAFEKAEKAIAELGEGWRMPTRPELESILDLSRYEPAIDTERFPDTKNAWYWTSTPCAWDSSAVWLVHFYNGSVSFSLRDYYACVRAVRVSQ